MGAKQPHEDHRLYCAPQCTWLVATMVATAVQKSFFRLPSILGSHKNIYIIYSSNVGLKIFTAKRKNSPCTGLSNKAVLKHINR